MHVLEQVEVRKNVRREQLPWNSFLKGIVFEATTYKKKYGTQWLERESPNTLPINTHCGREKGRNYHRTLPQKLSRVCWLFLRHGGTMECTLNGHRKYSADLVQGGLEVPWSILFKAMPEEIKKLNFLTLFLLLC